MSPATPAPAPSPSQKPTAEDNQQDFEDLVDDAFRLLGKRIELEYQEELKRARERLRLQETRVA